MSVRSFVSSILLALVLVSAVTAAPAAAKHKTKVTHKAKKKRKKPRATVATPAVCANTTLAPDAGNLDLITEALDCLHDQVRSRNGLGTLAENPALDAAAAAHTDDMIARGYFEHETPEGDTFDRRILSAGYARPGQGW